MGRGTRSVMLLAAFTVVAFGIHTAGPVLLPILVGICMAAGAQPLVDFLERHGLPTIVAVPLAVLVMIGLFAAAIATLAVGAADLASDLPRYEHGLELLQRDLRLFLEEARLPILARFVAQQDVSAMLTDIVTSLITEMPVFMSGALLAYLIAFFALMERNSLAAKLGTNVAPGEAFSTGRSIVRDVQRYLGVKTVVCALTGLLAGLVCVATDVPNPVLWASAAFLLNYIPVLGSIVAAVPPVALALVIHGAPIAFVVALAYALINLVVGNVLEPRWLGRAAGLSPLTVVLAMVIWGGLLGPVGALLSVPVTMVMKIAFHHTRDLNWVARLLDPARPRPSRAPEPLDDEVEGPASSVRPSLFGQP